MYREDFLKVSEEAERILRELWSDSPKDERKAAWDALSTLEPFFDAIADEVRDLGPLRIGGRVFYSAHEAVASYVRVGRYRPDSIRRLKAAWAADGELGTRLRRERYLYAKKLATPTRTTKPPSEKPGIDERACLALEKYPDVRSKAELARRMGLKRRESLNPSRVPTFTKRWNKLQKERQSSGT